jgi:hypothetical protein
MTMIGLAHAVGRPETSKLNVVSAVVMKHEPFNGTINTPCDSSS